MRFTVNGQQLELTAEDVRRELRDVKPEPLHQYAIQIGSALYPVKQAFEVVTGVPRSRFTTQVAPQVLATMGFDAVADSGQLHAGEEMPHADVSDVAGPAATVMPPREGDWHTEARVEAMLVRHLHQASWEIVRSADTARRERGIAIEATTGAETAAIEVKGFPGRDDVQKPEVRRAGRHRVSGLSAVPRALPSDGRTAQEMRDRTLVGYQRRQRDRSCP